MNVLIFEDDFVERLSPVSTGRAAFAIACAGYRLIDLVQQISSDIACFVRPHLNEVTRADFPFLIGLNELADLADQDKANEPCLCLNARLAPIHANLTTIQEWYKQHTTGDQIVSNDGVMAAIVDRSQIDRLKQERFSSDCFGAGSKPEAPSLDSINQLHDLVRIQCAALSDNLQQRIDRGTYTEIADGVFSADSQMKIPEHVVCNSGSGPIVFESGCLIGPFTFLEGPIYLGSNCKVAEHSSIKDGVTAGTTCKLGGEIEATIVESYSNKQHHGFLGHSYLGSWINLGAGTCNSDLKNTYGQVNMRRGDQKIATGMQFVGCFMGDYAKTAINTSIFTGKTIGVCSMVYGFAANDVAAFTNDARLLGKVTAIDPKVMIQTQSRMFGRRNVTQRECDIELIKAMFQLTIAERDGLPVEPLVF